MYKTNVKLSQCLWMFDESDLRKYVDRLKTIKDDPDTTPDEEGMNELIDAFQGELDTRG